MNTKSKFLIFLLIFISFESYAFWGPKSFEECMAKEMKGRAKEQIEIIENLCYKKFPTLKNFMDNKYYGEIICNTSSGNSFRLNITQDSVSRFKILIRNSTLIAAEDREFHIFDNSGIRFELSLETGIATMRSIANRSSKTSFNCLENRN